MKSRARAEMFLLSNFQVVSTYLFTENKGGTAEIKVCLLSVFVARLETDSADLGGKFPCFVFHGSAGKVAPEI